MLQLQKVESEQTFGSCNDICVLDTNTVVFAFDSGTLLRVSLNSGERALEEATHCGILACCNDGDHIVTIGWDRVARSYSRDLKPCGCSSLPLYQMHRLVRIEDSVYCVGNGIVRLHEHSTTNK